MAVSFEWLRSWRISSVRLGDGVVIVTVVVIAKPLIPDVAEDQEGRACDRHAAFTQLAEEAVTSERRCEDEQQPDHAVHDDPDIPVCAAAERQSDEACREDEPEQDGMESRIPKECGREDRECDDGYRDQQTVNGTHCRDQDSGFVAE